MAVGRVCTGYSCPYVAKYVNSSGTISYSDGMRLARGVSVNISIEVSGKNVFRADNQDAENEGSRFVSGEATFVVDGLKNAAEQMITGVSAPTSPDTWMKYGDDAEPPYVAVGFIARYMSDGVTTYEPTILRKSRFNIPEESHETQDGEEINWQTQTLVAELFRDDSSSHDWKWKGVEEATEAAAEAKIKTALGITTSGG